MLQSIASNATLFSHEREEKRQENVKKLMARHEAVRAGHLKPGTRQGRGSC